MSKPSILGETYKVILKKMVETGQAPHYTEIAAELGVSVEEGRRTLHDLFSAGMAA
jgi:DNA-directed RNA polymerase specialized sigma subunit